MKEKKINKFLLTTSILSTVILLIGATFSYFSVSTMSKINALAVEAGKVKVGLGVSPLYTGHKLIPTNDSDIMTAYNQNCLDDYNMGACLAYNLEVYNFSEAQEVIGTIDFNVENISNLSYMLLDESGNIYQNKVAITGDTSSMPLGSSFNLEKASETLPVSKKFTLIVWLSNLDEDQNEYDGGGNFSANVTFATSYNGRLTGTINGESYDEASTSKVGGA